MKVKELKQRLIEEGCNPALYSIGPGGSDVFCLENQNGMWRVYYTERGKVGDQIFESASEETACDFYFDYITKHIRHDHMVGFFVSESKANALRARLEQAGISSFQDKIPYGGWNDPRYRVFVTGKSIFKVREILAKIPMKD